MMENLTEMMTVKEVADFLKTCEMTIYRMAKEGKIPAFKIGSDWRFRKEAVSAWVLSKELENNSRENETNNKNIELSLN